MRSIKFPLRKTRSYKIRVLPLVYTFLGGTLCYTYIFKYNKQDVQCLAVMSLNNFDLIISIYVINQKYFSKHIKVK